MKMVAGLLVVLVVAFALPSAFASLEMKDVITREAYENLVNSGAIQSTAMTKTIISNPILEEALVTYAKNKLGGSVFNCGETCVFGTCFTSGCSCVYRVCSKDSLPDNKNNKAVVSSNSGFNPLLEAALVSYARKGLTGIPICGETCFQGTCNTPGCTCNWPICERNSLTI